MTISPHDAWVLARVLADLPVDGELAAMDEPWRQKAASLLSLAQRFRPSYWDCMTVDRPDRSELLQALGQVDPLGPAPAAATPAAATPAAATFATLADVSQIIASQAWLWNGWIAQGVLNTLASDPGVGKTRFAMDLARRLYLGLPWPDGQPTTRPQETKTLWVQGDRNFAEMLQLARDFGLPEQAVALGSDPSEPFGSLDLDDPLVLAALSARIEAAAVPLAVIDTVGMTTCRNLSRPDEARAFFAPLLELCHQTDVALLGLTHLSKDREALGRRIVEKARVVIQMTQPDPDGQRDRRRLWVQKSAVLKPPPLGITMGSAGNEYDLDPPSGPSGPDAAPRRPGRPPAKLEECKTWLAARLTPQPATVKDLRSAAETAGFSADTLYTAMRSLAVQEFTRDRRKWWQLPPPGEAVEAALTANP